MKTLGFDIVLKPSVVYYWRSRFLENIDGRAARDGRRYAVKLIFEMRDLNGE